MPSERAHPAGAAPAPPAGDRPGRGRRLLAAALRLAVGAAWALLFSELFVRALWPTPVLPRHVGATPHGIRGNMPGARYWQRTRDASVPIRINAQGIRADRAIPYAKPAGTRRIVTLGDSFVMGFEVDLDETFLAQMERELAAAGLRCETVNLAVSGFGNAEELIALEREGFRYQPDLVLLGWHASDLDDNVRSNLFALENGRLAPRAREYLPGARIAERLDGIPVYRWLDDNSQAFTLLREKATLAVKALLALRHPRALAATPAAAGAAVPAAPRGPDARDRLAMAILRRIQAECDSAGTRLLVLNIPDRTPGRREFVSKFPWAVAESLDVLDPLPELYRHAGEGLYREHGHGHFSPAGCRLVGHLLAERIRSEGLLGR